MSICNVRQDYFSTAPMEALSAVRCALESRLKIAVTQLLVKAVENEYIPQRKYITVIIGAALYIDINHTWVPTN